MNINPLGKEKEDLKRFYLLAALVHSNFSAIQQYSNGVVPVSKSILHPSKYNKLRHMFKRGLDYNYDFNQVITLFRYSQTDFETELNEELNLRDWIIEFELFFNEHWQQWSFYKRRSSDNLQRHSSISYWFWQNPNLWIWKNRSM